MTDAHYTPEWLADEMAAALPLVPIAQSRPNRVVDIAAGNGSLLAAVSRRVKRVSLTALDVDGAAVRRMKRRYPDWVVGQVDVYSDRSRRASAPWQRRSFDALIINPPFSYRGGSTQQAGPDLRATPAMTFLLRGMELVRPGGTAVALLPANCLTSERDHEAREELRRRATVRCMQEYGRTAFATAKTRTVLVSVTLRPATAAIGASAAVHRNPARPRVADRSGRPAGCCCLLLRRGSIPMFDIDRHRAGPLIPLVHTTHLQRGHLQPSALLAGQRYAVHAPVVLLPRVGRPSANKVVAYTAGGAIALTDCVFAIECGTAADAVDLAADLVANFEALEASYGGSCAPYLTINALSALIAELDWSMHTYRSQACPSGLEVAQSAP